jgi:hypothetical protein
MILLLLLGLLGTAPAFSQVPNSACYLVGQDMAQHRPCRPAETR